MNIHSVKPPHPEDAKKPPVLVDADRRQLLAADPQKSVWVGASAGTGKTKVLTDRVLSLLLTGSAPHRLLCLTFTKAAAAEMSNRVAKLLSRWAIAPEPQLFEQVGRLLGREPSEAELTRARRLFAQVLDAPGGMKIQTIHAFCQSLLRRFPLEADLAPHFDVLEDRTTAELMEAAKEEVLLRARNGDGKLAEALALVTGLVHEVKFPELMTELSRDRGRLRRLIAGHGGVEGAIAALRDRLGVAEGDTPEGLIAAACEDSAFAIADCRALMRAFEQGGKTDVERAAKMADWLAGSAAERIFGWQAWCEIFLTTTGSIRAERGMATKGAKEAFPRALDVAFAEAERLVRIADKARAAALVQSTAALLRLGGALVDAYQSRKQARAAMDFDDLILAARDLLSNSSNAWVLFKLDGGIDHVLIDEAQDTNPDQWAVVEALTAEFFAGLNARESLRTVFAVGDSKQSIYSFQRADPREFERMRKVFRDRLQGLDDELREVALQVSFRSTRAVLEAVDAIFRLEAGRDGVALDGEEIEHIAARSQDGGLVEIWPPIKPEEDDEAEAWKPPVEATKRIGPRARLAKLVAARIRAMVGAEVLDSRARPIRAGDIMVLVRRRNAFVEDLVRELKFLGVEVAGVDRMVLLEQMAVMDLVALGNFILLPDDDLTLATVLKGPLIGLSEEDLFTLAHKRRGSLWRELASRRDDAAFKPAFEVLTEIADRADRVPPHDLYAHLLIAMGGRKKLLERLGAEAEDPIDEFMALALAFEQGHAPSLQGFLHWLEAGNVEVKRDLEQSSRDAVRIMTVHGSKGLQAPIVILPDTMQVPTKTGDVLWLGERGEEIMAWAPRKADMDSHCLDAAEAIKLAQAQEYRRLLYVALTRAEDRLYVCGYETRRAAPAECWYNLIRDALSPLAEEIDLPFLAAAGLGKALRHGCKQDGPAKTEQAKAVHKPLDRLPDWVSGPIPEEPNPPRPLAPSRPDGEEPPVRSPLDQGGTAHFRRGQIIHKLLQILPDLAQDRRSAAMARFLARPAWSLAAAEQVAIAAEVSDILEDSRFARIFGPGSRAEVPVVGAIGNDRVISGQVDRLLVTPDEVLVVDYKTNRKPPKRAEDVPGMYLRQMAAYRMALACIYPNCAIRCALVWTDGPSLMVLDPKMMDDSIAGLLH